MFWFAIAALLVGLYYLLCAFVPAIRLVDGSWKFHLAPSAFIWVFPASTQGLHERPVSRLAFLLTGGGFFGFGAAGILHHEGYVGDAFVFYVLSAALLTSLIAIVLDRLDAPNAKRGQSTDGDGPYVI